MLTGTTLRYPPYYWSKRVPLLTKVNIGPPENCGVVGSVSDPH
jgi:hypothetical protein